MGISTRHLACLLLLLVNWQAQAVEKARHVLIVHSFGRDYAPFYDVAGQFRTDLAKLSPEPIEFLEASLEMARFDGKEQDGPLVDYLAAVFKDKAPDLVVPIGAPAAQFCQRHRGQLFPQSPMLVAGMDERRVRSIITSGDIVVAGVEMDLPQLLQNIFQVLPKTKHVYVVMGTAPLEHFWEQELKREWKPMESRVQIYWLSGQSVEEMKSTLQAAPPDSVVMSGILNRDGAGVPFEQDSALIQLHQKATMPFFGFSRVQLGLGIVGGKLISMKESGTAGAQAAVRLLAGEAAANIHVEPQRYGKPVYDWRELQRWNIRKSILPPENTILYREPSLWEAHRTAALVILAVTIFQACLIALLLITRSRAREVDTNLSLAADAANVGLWRRDLVTDRMEVSPRMRALFGAPMAGRISVENLLDCIHPGDRDRVKKLIAESERDGSAYEVEYRVQLPAGESRWLVSIGNSETGQGRRHARGVTLDITERKQIEMELARQRNQLVHLSRVASLGVLSGSLAHEINQPLGIILSNAQAAQRMLEQEPLDLPELKEILADIVSEDRRAGDVIRRLRALVQQGETIHQPVDVNETVQDVLRLLRNDLFSRKFTVDFQPGARLFPVQADRVQLQQVWLNLIVNACDAMADNLPEDRILDLTTGVKDGAICVAVRDRGAGLVGETQSLFQPFYTTKPNGLGLGLAICRMLVEAHGGRVRAEANIGQGATFYVTLPLGPVPV